MESISALFGSEYGVLSLIVFSVLIFFYLGIYTLAFGDTHLPASHGPDSLQRRKIYFSSVLFLPSLISLGLLAIAVVQGQTLYANPAAPHWIGVDSLSGVLLVVVTTIGSVVTRYSVRYLEDDPEQSRFMRMLAATLTSVILMLTSRNLIVFFMAWVGTSYFLHQLLTHFSDRKPAIEAARQKFWISRLGDALLLVAFALFYQAFGTFHFEEIASKAADSAFMAGLDTQWMYTACVFLVVGAMSKSAQFPFHFWLPKTMETPTPVSALMHAGIINAGGYLVIRMSPVLTQFPHSLDFLAIMGGFTAVFGALIMLTQTDVKRNLAYSTISQMGFMMLQCGLGAFAVATLHIVGHAFYKAYAFLSAGSVVDHGWLSRYFGRPQAVGAEQNGNFLWKPLASAVISFALLFGISMLLQVDLAHKPGAAILTLILGLAMAQTLMSADSKWSTAWNAILVCGTYFLLYKGMNLLLAASVPVQEASFDAFDTVCFAVIGGLFFVLFFVQNNLRTLGKSAWGRRLYVSVYNGFYFGK